MRFRLRTLMIAVAILPAIVWATTLWLATLIEWAGPKKYNPSGLGPNSSEQAKVATDAVSTTSHSSGGASDGQREVKYSVDGGGGIVISRGTATINFTAGKVKIEKTRVLLNEKQVATVPADSKVVEMDYTAGNLTITADETTVYEHKLAN